MTTRMAKEGQPDSDVHPDEVENWQKLGWTIEKEWATVGATYTEAEALAHIGAKPARSKGRK